MLMRNSVAVCFFLATFAAPVCAQTASEALDSAWVAACAEADPGTAFYDRCQEILNAGPGSGARRSAAALGNNLEIFAAQGRLMMQMAKRRGRAAARASSEAASEQASEFRLADPDPEGDAPELLASGERWSLFGSAALVDSQHRDTGFERGYDQRGHTLLVGADYRWSPRWNSLLALSRETAKVDFESLSGRLDSTTDQASLALAYTGPRSFSASLALSAGRQRSELQREINYTLTLNAGQPNEQQVTITSQGGSDNSASTRGAEFEFGWDRGVGAWTLRYGGDFSWQRTHVSRIAEDNDVGLDFLILEQEVLSQRAGLGFQAARAYSFSGGVWQPYLRLHWVHEFGDDPRRVFAAFRGGRNIFKLSFMTGEPDRSFGEAGIGIIGVFPRGWQAYAGWQRTLGNDLLDEDRFDVGWRREF